MTEPTFDISPDGPPCPVCGINLVPNRRWRTLPVEYRQQLSRQRLLGERRALGMCARCCNQAIKNGDHTPEKREKYIKSGRFKWPESQIKLPPGRWVKNAYGVRKFIPDNPTTDWLT